MTLGDDIMGKEGGMEKLTAYLDSIYDEDDITDTWIKYRKFVEVKNRKD